ncbi:MAG: hypothetical protein A3F72_06245 [Bacteroidetes bacterium RIFCSPLOWO2_12_FULL_35_15]|nr:MAG: hypothetical protein A3F72_06245 [Bacteroidetes bacterium RIFCSPLOWO2_12_FULL_35_15]
MTFFYSCKKDVPSGKINYVGTWTSQYSDETIIIDSNGGGSWESNSGGVSKNISGRVVFKSPGFIIKALGFKKKFTIETEPTLSVNSYSGNYYYATFNGTNFTRN